MAYSNTNGYSPRFGAKNRSLDIAITLLENEDDKKEIHLGYSQLLYQREIAKNLDVAKRFNVTERCATNAVGFAIRGYQGDDKYLAFEGLFDKSDLERIEKDHAARRDEELYERKIGPYRKVDSETKKISALEALKAQGKIQLKPEEPELAYELSLNPDYQYQNGKQGRPNLAAIAEELNKKLYEGKTVRTRRSVSNMLSRHRKRLAQSGKR